MRTAIGFLAYAICFWTPLHWLCVRTRRLWYAPLLPYAGDWIFRKDRT